MDNDYHKHLVQTRDLWDKEASTFDQEADHGLKQSHVRQAWQAVLQDTLIVKPDATALDIGCGTGSISILLSELGYDVSGIDLSPNMIEIALAKAKKNKQAIDFRVMDAAFPQLEHSRFDLILCRHVLWALANPKDVIKRWLDYLKPTGQLVLIEGFWETGGGLHAEDVLTMLPSTLGDISVQSLSQNTALWGKNVTDERYLITAQHMKA